ncbi:MAG: 3-hydroxyacyl-ACP dehydratase [Planctomycetes bacterium]|nr:3-hydroxyacyl-ACP dehydratase [Planctomycetota bacterium]
MRAAGLDIGSRTIELVVIDDRGRAVSSAQGETTPDVVEDARRLLAENRFDRLVVTGYGRALAEVAFDAPTVTEILAYARGAHDVCPGCRTVLDIGGQDTKVIALDGAGRPLRFAMNDRCAAGAGRFLEMTAEALHYEIGAFGSAALDGRDGIAISSMCAVFAESEVIGMMTRGHDRRDIARAVHRAIAGRSAGMLARVSNETPIVFAGGAALNPGLRVFLEEAIGLPLVIPEMPQMLGARGAALIAAGRARAT